jgi:hypothetical protein
MQNVRYPLTQACAKDGAGKLIEDSGSPSWAVFRSNALNCFPEDLRNQTLFVIRHWSTYYRNRLLPDQYACLRQVSRRSVVELEAVGYSAVECGPDLALDDYLDVIHLKASGGAKLAQSVADKVRAMSKRLGYID